MDADLQRTCEMFIRNRDLLSETFRWEGSAMHTIGSAVLTSHSMEPEIDKMKECAQIIKDNAGMLSPLRGYLKIMVICNMLLSSDPEEYFRNIERAYNLIRITRRMRDQQFYLAAIAMCNVVADKEELLGMVDKTNEIYARLRNVKNFREDGKGYVLAAVVAATHTVDIDAYLAEAERCSEMLEDTFDNTSDLTELCCILALDKANAELKCVRLKEIFRLLDAEGIDRKSTRLNSSHSV